MKILHLVISDDMFGGFECYVKVDANIYTKKHLVNAIIEKLVKALDYNKLENAKDFLKNKSFHIHDMTFPQILESNNTIYVCGTC